MKSLLIMKLWMIMVHPYYQPFESLTTVIHYVYFKHLKSTRSPCWRSLPFLAVPCRFAQGDDERPALGEGCACHGLPGRWGERRSGRVKLGKRFQKNRQSGCGHIINIIYTPIICMICMICMNIYIYILYTYRRYDIARGKGI